MRAVGRSQSRMLKILPTALFAFGFLGLAAGTHENLCFGIPVGRKINQSAMEEEQVGSLWTVGSQFWYNEPSSYSWKGIGFPYPKAPVPNPPDFFPGGPATPRPGVKWVVKANSIKKANGTSVMGWMRLNISHIGSGSNVVIERLAITARGMVTDSNGALVWMSSIGEFTHDGRSCDQSDETYSNYQKMSCGGANAYQSQVGNGLVFIRHLATGNWSEWGPSNNGTGEIAVYFRLTQTPCQFVQTLRFRVMGLLLDLNGQNLTYVADTETVEVNLSPVFLGPPEGPSNETVDCSAPLDAGDWNGQIKSASGTVDLREANCYDDYTCTPDLEELRPRNTTNSAGDDIPWPFQQELFTGRCKCRVDGSRDTVHQCAPPDQALFDPAQLAAYQELGDYDEVVKNISEWADGLCDPCPSIPPRPSTPAPPPYNITYNYRTELSLYEKKALDDGSDIDVRYMILLWDGRVFHGILMALVTFFILPINGFMARYFKETFMDHRIWYHRIWYFLHHHFGALCVTLMGVGLTPVFNRRGILGVSLEPEAFLHRACGWGSVGVAALLLIFGGCRSISIPVRCCLIAMHFFMGAGVYVGSLFCFLSSARIPACPSAFLPQNDVSWKGGGNGLDLLNWNDFLNRNNLTFILACLWIVFDISMHLTLTVWMCVTDCKLKLTKLRYYFPSPMPVVNEHFRFDVPGMTMRKIVLFVYVLMSIGVTIGICHFIYIADPRGRKLGKMSCTHHPQTGKLRNVFPTDLKNGVIGCIGNTF